jgi:hypothetical protein
MYFTFSIHSVPLFVGLSENWTEGGFKRRYQPSKQSNHTIWEDVSSKFPWFLLFILRMFLAMAQYSNEGSIQITLMVNHVALVWANFRQLFQTSRGQLYCMWKLVTYSVIERWAMCKLFAQTNNVTKPL